MLIARTTKRCFPILEQLGLTSSKRARDLWKREEFGTFDKELAFELPAHGAMLMRLY
ncbi:hypothetical protein LJK88_23555 [Paenibacillus sp. P26]|nr:hypothetical protein LJK88_23555 [Paenibacillus sp. P26]UUZ95516.1 hypothetical protein LJK87_14315 [Paenibacillus sp. P25]